MCPPGSRPARKGVFEIVQGHWAMTFTILLRARRGEELLPLRFVVRSLQAEMLFTRPGRPRPTSKCSSQSWSEDRARRRGSTSRGHTDAA